MADNKQIFNPCFSRPTTLEEQIFQLYDAVKTLADMQIVPELTGTWNATTNYNRKYMLVYDSADGGSYLRIADGDCIGSRPSLNVDKWQPVAAQGQTGVSIVRVENDGETVANGFTITHVTVTLSDGTEEPVDIRASNGANGTSITNVSGGSPGEQQDYTVTPITVTYSTGQTQDFNVYAKNGKEVHHTIYQTVGQISSEQAVFDFTSSPGYPQIPAHKTLSFKIYITDKLSGEYFGVCDIPLAYANIVGTPFNNMKWLLRFPYSEGGQPSTYIQLEVDINGPGYFIKKVTVKNLISYSSSADVTAIFEFISTD